MLNIIMSFLIAADIPAGNIQESQFSIPGFKLTNNMMYFLYDRMQDNYYGSPSRLDATSILFEAGGGLLGGIVVGAIGGIGGTLVAFLTQPSTKNEETKKTTISYALWGAGIGYTIGVPIGIWEVGKSRGKEGGFLLAFGLSIITGIIGGYCSVEAENAWPLVTLPLVTGLIGYNLAAKPGGSSY